MLNIALHNFVLELNFHKQTQGHITCIIGHPFYNDWVIIFEKDQAIGKHGQTFADVLANLVNGGTSSLLVALGDETADNINFTDAENVSQFGGESNSSTRTNTTLNARGALLV